ncbi:MAG TPA: Ig-like domain-containing protein [Kofleriaceae bacterium]|nr:Ig-like domain-containing protein [Kofleriaceae bacterium]
MGWYARIIFDELLDTGVETLIEVEGAMVGSLATTQPVTLICGGNPVAYDGFYDPAGNSITFPPGPALVIEPTEFVATGTACTVQVKAQVIDKQGEAVAPNGPFNFSIAGLAYVGSDPADMAEGVDPAAGILVIFNAPIDGDTLGTKIALTDANAAAVAATVAVDPADPSLVVITPTAALAENAVYTVTVTSETADPIADIGGGTIVLATPITFSFTTGMAPAPDAA